MTARVYNLSDGANVPLDEAVEAGRRHSHAHELTCAAETLRRRGDDLSVALAEWLELEAHRVGKRGNSIAGHTFHALKVARVVGGPADGGTG